MTSCICTAKGSTWTVTSVQDICRKNEYETNHWFLFAIKGGHTVFIWDIGGLSLSLSRKWKNNGVDDRGQASSQEPKDVFRKLEPFHEKTSHCCHGDLLRRQAQSSRVRGNQETTRRGLNVLQSQPSCCFHGNGGLASREQSDTVHTVHVLKNSSHTASKACLSTCSNTQRNAVNTDWNDTS